MVEQQFKGIEMLIVGAGISGLALARALRQFDIETRILDKRNQHAEAGLAINLPGNAIQALERLGLKEQVDALGYPTKRREYRTAKGKLLFSVNETDSGASAISRAASCARTCCASCKKAIRKTIFSMARKSLKSRKMPGAFRWRFPTMKQWRRRA
ncbi:NAD(P)-binding protein [Brucella abortus]|nr:hypothetical protein C1A46_04950 [Brucella abortus]QIS27839.1 NAD(P)-binding protein [Brucella abortus RB51-AHVLA]AYU62912.1 hypothetical protein EAI02_04525 [Brucella abortus]AZS91148.1 hypothetical protein EIA50_04975 [Brucella abortus]MUJ18338.1 NAD(P)-binding protein [Brucella abortus]